MDADPVGITAGEQGRPRCRADRLGHVKVGEPPSLPGRAGRDWASRKPLAPKAADVAVSLVVREDDDDIGRPVVGAQRCARGAERWTERQANDKRSYRKLASESPDRVKKNGRWPVRSRLSAATSQYRERIIGRAVTFHGDTSLCQHSGHEHGPPVEPNLGLAGPRRAAKTARSPCPGSRARPANRIRAGRRTEKSPRPGDRPAVRAVTTAVIPVRFTSSPSAIGRRSSRKTWSRTQAR